MCDEWVDFYHATLYLLKDWKWFLPDAYITIYPNIGHVEEGFLPKICIGQKMIWQSTQSRHSLSLGWVNFEALVFLAKPDMSPANSTTRFPGASPHPRQRPNQNANIN